MSFQEYSESLRSRLKLGNINKKVAIGLTVFAVAALMFSAYTFFMTNSAYSSDTSQIEVMKADENTSEYGDSNESLETAQSNNSIYVHVAGCVKDAGVYCISGGSRIDDAIKAAGGFTKSADQTAINLAEVVSDGQQIIVPKKTNKNAGGESAISSSVEQTTQDASANTTNGIVNINVATSEQLQTLSGIGEAKAKKIIDYRMQNGSFSSIDELTNISGIGEKTLESIKPYICI